jgi:hypothetical protein
MKVMMACPAAWLKDHEAAPQLGNADVGDVVDVDDRLAAKLRDEGYVQYVVSALTADNVDQVAAAEGIDLSEAKTVPEKKAVIKAAAKEG